MFSFDLIVEFREAPGHSSTITGSLTDDNDISNPGWYSSYMHHHTTTLLGRKSFQIMQWNTSRQQKINIDIEICYVTWKFTETSFWSTLWEEGNIEWMFICPRPQSNLSLFQFLQRTLLDHQSPAKSSGWHPQDLWPQLWTLLPETLAPFSMPPRLDRSVWAGVNDNNPIIFVVMIKVH